MPRNAITHSPTPQKSVMVHQTMDFPDALRQVIAGKNVTKLEWQNPDIVVGLVEGHLRIKLLTDNLWHDLIVSDGDLLGTDWVVVD